MDSGQDVFMSNVEMVSFTFCVTNRKIGYKILRAWGCVSSPIPNPGSWISSLECSVSSLVVLRGLHTRTLTHSDTHNRGGRHRGEFVLQMVACFWSRHKFWRLTSSGSWSWSGKSKSWGRIAQNGEDERRRRHFVSGYKSFMQVALAVCVEIKI